MKTHILVAAAVSVLGALALPSLAHAQHAVVVAEAGVRAAPVADCAVFTSVPAGRPYHVESCLANVITVHRLPEYRHRHVVVHDRVLRPSGVVVYIYD